jgi:hypothetical protein
VAQSKDMKVLGEAELFTNTLMAHPKRTTGKALVAILSTMDDVSVGAGSTRFEVLSAAITEKAGTPKSQTLFFMSEAINSCQRALVRCRRRLCNFGAGLCRSRGRGEGEIKSCPGGPGAKPHLLIWARFEAF